VVADYRDSVVEDTPVDRSGEGTEVATHLIGINNC